MDLLNFEFYTEENGAYDNLIGELVRKVRYYREQVSIDDFMAAMPELQQMETRIQEIDISLGEERRYYIKEIMDELSKENDDDYEDDEEDFIL